MKSVFPNRHIRVNIALLAFTVIVVSIISAVSTNALVRRDRETTTRLIFDVLNRTMDDAFDRPLEAARTMEKDAFLRDFLRQEEETPSAEFSAAMGHFLKEIGSGKQWSGAYFSSAKTLNYYDANGFAKVIDPEKDPYDLWYTHFIDSGADYDIDVEYDQMNEDIWTVFLDKRMEDENDTLLGVCTVAMKMDQIQQTIAKMEADYTVRICFMDRDGAVQVSSDEEAWATGYIPQGDEGVYSTGSTFAMAKFIPLLDWYLIIENTQDAFREVVGSVVTTFFGFMILLVIAIVVVNMKMAVNAQNVLTRKAETDSLTDALNRDGTEKRIRNYLNSTEGERAGGAFLMVDLDHLKEINDQLGHAAGDDALIRTADVLKRFLRANDIVGRMGGDEFAAFIPGLVGREMIGKKANQLLAEGNFALTREGKTVQSTVSIGISVFPEQGEGYMELYSKADKALYAAKAAGESRYQIYEGP